MLITLRRDATCKQCGAAIAAGEKAKWYRNGDVYGLDCHTRRNREAYRDSYRGEDYPCSDRGYEDACREAVSR